jgi:hypothetical protein
MGGKQSGVKRLRLVWKDDAWAIEGEEALEDATLPPSETVPDTSPFYWDVVDPGGAVAYARVEADPRVAYYDHVTDEGEIEGGQFASEYAVMDVLVPDTPGAEFRLYAGAPEARAKDKPKKVKKHRPAVALTHRIGGPRG